MKSTMFIPQKLKVGYQNRHDTFTGKLAYVIYYDEKNKLRKETSWENWRDKKLDPMDVDNVPTSGFVFNKGVTRFSDWGSGRSMIRIHDPRGFEFEITLDNLIGILMYSDVSKRDIVEQCVFAWYGTELVLLPVNSVEYQESLAYTNKQSKKVSAKELVEGRQYQLKKHDKVLTYIGYREWYELQSDYEYASDHRQYSYYYSRTYTYTKVQVLKGKKHVFWDGTNFVTPAPSTLSNEVSDDIVSNYSDLVDAFFNTVNSQPVVGVQLTELEEKDLKCSKYSSSFPVYSMSEDATSFIRYSFPVNEIRQMLRDATKTQSIPLSMSGETHNISVLDGKYTDVTNSAKNSSFAIPFDYTGTCDNMINMNDISLDDDADSYYRSVSFTPKVWETLNNMKFGIIKYKLKNGNTINYI